MPPSTTSGVARRAALGGALAATTLLTGCGQDEIRQAAPVFQAVAMIASQSRGGYRPASLNVPGLTNASFYPSSKPGTPGARGLGPDSSILAAFGALSNPRPDAGMPRRDSPAAPPSRQGSGSFPEVLPLPAGSWTVQNNGHFWDIRGGGARPHHGVDLRAPDGTAVYAVSDGVVERVKHDPDGYDWYIMIKHDARSSTGHAYRTLYAHIRQEPGLEVGQRVTAGTKIAEIESAGVSFDHCHFEILIDDGGWKGTPVDPNAYARFHSPGAHGTQYAGAGPEHGRDAV